MINFVKKYFILFFLGFLILILIFLKIFYGDVDENNINIYPTSTPIPTIIEMKNDLDNPVSEENETTILPYKGKLIQITGYLEPGKLEVVIKKEEDKLEAEKEVNLWVEKNPMFKTDTFVYNIR
jgi:hypothetical protein